MIGLENALQAGMLDPRRRASLTLPKIKKNPRAKPEMIAAEVKTLFSQPSPARSYACRVPRLSTTTFIARVRAGRHDVFVMLFALGFCCGLRRTCHCSSPHRTSSLLGSSLSGCCTPRASLSRPSPVAAPGQYMPLLMSGKSG